MTADGDGDAAHGFIAADVPGTAQQVGLFVFLFWRKKRGSRGTACVDHSWLQLMWGVPLHGGMWATPAETDWDPP
jgi:hypothetical protein